MCQSSKAIQSRHTIISSLDMLVWLMTMTFFFSCHEATGERDINEDSASKRSIIKERVIYKENINKSNCFIVISKRDLCLSVYETVQTDTLLVAIFPVCLGKNKGPKETSGDMKTPECSSVEPFEITNIQDASTWTHDFGDGRGTILAYGNWFLRLKTGFNGIGIHGSTNNEETVPGRASEGCIRLKDNDIIYLKEHYASVGMKVIIKGENDGLLGFEILAHN